MRFHYHHGVHVIISTLLYLLHLLSLHKSFVYLPVTYVLYDECSDDVRVECNAIFHMNNEKLRNYSETSRARMVYFLERCKHSP